jgi:ribose transport system substrate-binding protein
VRRFHGGVDSKEDEVHGSMKVPVLVFLVLLDLVGCAGMHSPREKYFLVVANVKIPYWQAAAAGLMQAARELQVNAELVGPSTYDPKAEQQEFQRVARLKPAGILISPADPGLMAPDIDAAIDAGIPVITMDSDSPASKRLLFIGTNNYEAGFMGGRIIPGERGRSCQTQSNESTIST